MSQNSRMCHLNSQTTKGNYSSSQSNLLAQGRSYLAVIKLIITFYRAIQNFIPKANSLELDVIIFELKPHLTDVLLDPYANHMFQTLMHHSSPTQRITLLSNVSN